MKRIISTLMVLFVLLLGACGAPNSSLELPGHEVTDDYSGASNFPSEPPEASFEYLTFEESLAEFATDVVIAQYIDHRPFGQNLTEFEFVVLERVLGDAADRIFVYAEPINAHVIGSERDVIYRPGDLTFHPGTTYLLALIRVSNPYSLIQENGFVFIRNIVIDLDDPSKSIMYSEYLALHSESLDFDRDISRQDIISYVGELTRDNPPAREFIQSEEIEHIINESPYTLIVEINEPLRLSHEQHTTDWMLTDLYYVTVVQALKGEMEVGYQFVMTFFADTVLPGEQHIISVEQVHGGSFYVFTSRNSLFQMNQLNEVMARVEEIVARTEEAVE